MELVEMTKLKEQAVEMLLGVPDEKMVYVIDILKSLNGLFSGKSMSVYSVPSSETDVSSEAFVAWEAVKKYKGIINFNIDEKLELARARDEKYTSFN